MVNNIDKIISNALLVSKDNLKDVKTIINTYEEVINKSKDLINEASEIDIKNDNGFNLDFKVIHNLFNNIEEDNKYYGDVTLSLKDDEKKIIYGKQIMDSGNVVVIYDGNPYITIEMIARNIAVGNTTILVNDGYMHGTNQLLVQLFQAILNGLKISENMVQIYETGNYKEVLKNYANIDLVVCIGNHDLQRQVLDISKNKTIVSGYENYDLYVEDDKNIDFINEIMNTGLNINLYVNKSISIDLINVIDIEDIDEAIAQINYNSSRYSAAIFTNNADNASRFIKEIKSKIVTVNTSPTIERIIDIKQSDLYNEKTIIYPFDFKVSETIKIYDNTNLNN